MIFSLYEQVCGHGPLLFYFSSITFSRIYQLRNNKIFHTQSIRSLENIDNPVRNPKDTYESTR
jgi:hypothetical protein